MPDDLAALPRPAPAATTPPRATGHPGISAGGGTVTQVDLPVTGMSCASCVRRVEKALRAVPGVASAQANFVTGHTEVRLAPGVETAALRPALVSAVERAGYGLAPPPAAAEAPGWTAQEWLRPALAAVLAAPFLLGMAGMALGLDLMPGGWVQLVLASLLQFGIGAPVYRKAWGALRAGTGNMELLVALGTSAAWALSLFLLLRDGSHHALYFEAAATVLFFVTLGRFAEHRARGAAGAAVAALLRLRPEMALRLDAAGREEEVPSAALRPGDRVAVRPGGRIPADGVLEGGEAGVDEAALTGESRPVPRGPGDAVAAGTVVLDGRVVLRVSAVGGDTRIARIAALVESAGNSRAPVQRLADRVSAVFVPAVLGIAAATFAGWWWFGGDPSVALLNAVAVLVVACPCALGLATPAALVAGTGAAARAGILLRDAEAIERARGVSLVAFDKTGTLTLGRPALAALHPAPGVDPATALRMAARLQFGSEHPFARAVLDAAPGPVSPAEDFRALPGRGVSGRIDGRALRLGSDRLLDGAAVPDALRDAAAAEARAGRSQSWLIEDGRVLALLAFEDAPRPGAAEAVAALRAAGLEVAMLSGDHAAAAAAAARHFGIAEVAAQLLPEDKAARLLAWHAAGRRVAMVGDGVNDAPALAAADLGIAMGCGTDAALAAAHMALLRPDPRLVPAALAVARATWRAIAQNLGWAFAFNALAIPAAALGFLSPALAGGAMALSSLAVLGNALRLSRWTPAKELAA
ncbi:heavy metal translocating P-type ATPase [Roseomonas sp. BN140053]|uniref:heavy metal translocating P-type ATPase n=1 Tax=Roseomonas sp. BN140053 TaxID=3391898 RepID=UPI0039EC2AC6